MCCNTLQLEYLLPCHIWSHCKPYVRMIGQRARYESASVKIVFHFTSQRHRRRNKNTAIELENYARCCGVLRNPIDSAI